MFTVGESSGTNFFTEANQPQTLDRGNLLQPMAISLSKSYLENMHVY